MSIATMMNSIMFWISATYFFAIGFIVLTIIMIYVFKKTHAFVEIKALMRGQPICMFFQENRYVHWKSIKPDAGIITDKEYGAYIINERGTYVDKTTKNIIIPFDASIAASFNMHAAKLADDLQFILKDEEEMKRFRIALSQNLIDDTETITALKTNIHMGAMKSMLTALIPHNINAKIEKTIAARLKSYGNVNVPQILMIFCAMLGAIIIGVIIIKMTLKK
jgi:hypothetical protein